MPAASTILGEIITDAIKKKASDIHLEPSVSATVVRLRIEGILSQPYSLPLAHHAACIARLKALAGLRIDERFTAHDGRFALSDHTDARLSIVPTRLGEKAVIRILAHNNAPTSLTELGMRPDDAERLSSLILARSGIVMICGSTGSGKTTTLHALLRIIAREPRSVVTIEDPVEYTLDAVTQLPVTPSFSCSTALRAVLRQDPDTIAIGEIRDPATALLAVEAALTGHLVLATIHARSASSVMRRLLSLQVPHDLLTDSLLAIVAQRLERDGEHRHGVFEITWYEHSF